MARSWQLNVTAEVQ